MKRVTSTRAPDVGLDAADVEAYLRAHPQFFRDHLALLEVLTVPHPSGEAVSLVARQLDVLRDKNQRLLAQLDDLVDIARDNDALYQRIHQLTLTLIDARSVEDVLASLDWGLHQYFQADFGVVRIFKPQADSPVGNLFVSERSAEAAQFEPLIEGDKPLCGPPDPDQARFLFGEAADEVASQAVMGLRHAGLRGLFAIGSRDPDRFRADMGHVFLRQMAEILAARLAALLNQVP